MIALTASCLWFEFASGERIPLPEDMIAAQFQEHMAAQFRPEFVRQAVAAVFYYFKHDLRQEVVVVSDFAAAVEKVLRRLAVAAQAEFPRPNLVRVPEPDLRIVAQQAGHGCELFFFSRLRTEVKNQLHASPQWVRFHGLHGCVKHLTGARRWGPRCRALHDQIVEYLRACLGAERVAAACTLIVE